MAVGVAALLGCTSFAAAPGLGDHQRTGNLQHGAVSPAKPTNAPAKLEDGDAAAGNLLTLPLRTRIKKPGTLEHHRMIRRALQDVDSVGLVASTRSGYAYSAEVHLGTPAVGVLVDIDTGSATLAVPASFCSNCAVDIESYNPDASSTSSPMPCGSPRCDSTLLLHNPHCEVQPDGASCCSTYVGRSGKRACMHHDGYIDGSGINGPVINDVVTVGSASTTSFFKCYDDDEGGVGIGNHFAVAHSAAGIWGMGRQDPEKQDTQFGNGVFDMGSVLDDLLRSNSLGNKFGLCYEDSPAMFSDTAAEGASALDLGGADPLKYSGHMRFLPLLEQWTAYLVAGPAITLSGEGGRELALASTVKMTVDAVCQNTVDDGECASYLSLNFCDPTSDMYDNMQIICAKSCGSCVRGNSNVETFIDQVIVDSGNTGTLGLPPATMMALRDSMIAWFRTSSLQIRTRACTATDLLKDQQQGQEPGGYTCSRFIQILGCTNDTQSLCPVSCHVCKGTEGDSCTDPSDCGGGYFCNQRVCESCGSVSSSSASECQRLPSVAAELALSLFSPDSDSCDLDGAYFAAVNLDEFPTVALDFNGLILELPPSSYLEVNSGSIICRTVDVYPSNSGTQAMLGAGMLQQYYALFDREAGQLGLATRGDCTPGTRDSDSSPAIKCRARAGSCSQCVGPVDDLEQHRGYCTWCPGTSACTATDPKSLVSPCPAVMGTPDNALGFATHGLDNAQGGSCPDLETTQIACQSAYQQMTELVMLGGIFGSCSSDAQDSIDAFVGQCSDTEVRMHIGGHSQGVTGAACVLSVMKNSPNAHGMKQCSVPGADALCAAQTESCVSARDGRCDDKTACEPGTDAADCYGAPVVPAGSTGRTPPPPTPADGKPSCTSGLDAINAACPSHSKGVNIPDSCPATCAMIFDAWWKRCQRDSIVAALAGSFDLRAFSVLCESGRGGGHR